MTTKAKYHFVQVRNARPNITDLLLLRNLWRKIPAIDVYDSACFKLIGFNFLRFYTNPILLDIFSFFICNSYLECLERG